MSAWERVEVGDRGGERQTDRQSDMQVLSLSRHFFRDRETERQTGRQTPIMKQGTAPTTHTHDSLTHTHTQVATVPPQRTWHYIQQQPLTHSFSLTSRTHKEKHTHACSRARHACNTQTIYAQRRHDTHTRRQRTRFSMTLPHTQYPPTT